MATAVKRGGSYKITASCGYDSAGDQLRRHITWRPAPGMTPKQVEKELERQKVLFDERVKSGQFLDSSMKFSDFAEQWFKDYASKNLRPKTLSQYTGLMPRINAAIGHIRLDRLQPNQLIGFYNNLAEKGIRKDSKYSCKIDFKAALRERGITKVKLAKRAGVCVGVLDSITRGDNISRKSAEGVCAAMKVPLGDMFTQIDRNGGALAGKTIRHYHILIASILSTAVQWQIIASNPCGRVKAPKAETPARNYLDEVQAAEMLALLENEDIQFRTMIQLLLFTGFRRGELLGLCWEDVDLTNCVIEIKRTSLYLPARGVFEDTAKTASSLRSIKVPRVAVDALRDFKVWQTEQRLKAGDKWANSGRIFTGWNGKPLHPDTLTGQFREFVKRNGLPGVSVHSLRHPYVKYTTKKINFFCRFLVYRQGNIGVGIRQRYRRSL